MRITTRLLLCILFLFLYSCSYHKSTVDSARTVASCKQQCQKNARICDDACVNNCAACNICSKKKASNSYANYLREQCIQGGNIARELNSYCDPLQCRKTTCDCVADYKICIQSCASIIHK